MGVKIIVEGSSLAEIRAALEGGAPAWVVGIDTAAPGADLTVETPLPYTGEAPASVEAPAKKPVGRPRKAPVVDEAEAPKAEAPKAEEKPKEVEKPKPAKKLSLEDVRTALQDYAKRQDGDPQAGILKVRELLMSFKSVKGEPCQKISEVQDEDYAALVARCAA